MKKLLIFLFVVANLQACVSIESQLDPWVGRNIDELLSVAKRSPDNVRDIGGRYMLYEWTVTRQEKVDTNCQQYGNQVNCKSKKTGDSCTICFRVDDDGVIRGHEYQGNKCFSISVVKPPK